MRRRNALLLAVACLLVESQCAQASVIIKTAPHANVKMEFGAQHLPPHDVALQEESAKVDGTTHLGIEVPHSHNHRNVLIHKIGTYLTVVMKALAKTVAPSQNQDGNTHFDIHVDADLGEDDSKGETPQFAIVHSKHGEGEKHETGDCVKAVVIMSESENDDKKEEYKAVGKHIKDDAEIILHYSGEDSKDNLRQDIKQESDEKIHLSKEENKEGVSWPFKFQPTKDWNSFKKTQDMLKEKGFILQLDKSFFIPKEKQLKKVQKLQPFDISNNIKHFNEGKSLSEEDMNESERNWKSLELIEADPEEMWVSMINPADTNFRHQPRLEKGEEHPVSKAEMVHMLSASDPPKQGSQIQTVKTTAYQSGDGPVIVTTTNSVSEVPSPAGNKAVNYEAVKQVSKSEKTPMKVEHDQRQIAFTANEIPSIVSSHFQQTSYSSDRSRAVTIVAQDPALDRSNTAVSQPIVFQVGDKLRGVSESSKTLPYLKMHDDSREVIMHLAPTSKTGTNKKAQMIDVKKVKITKLADISDEVEPDGSLTRQEGIRNLPMANIPTLIDVLQNSPIQEVQRLTQLASGGTSQESQKDNSSAENSPVAPTNRTDLSPSKSLREFHLPELNVDDLNSEERKGGSRSIEELKSSSPTDDKTTLKATRNEKSHIGPADTQIPKEGRSNEEVSEKHTFEDPGGASAGLEVTKIRNPEDRLSAEESRSLKDILENPSSLKSVEDSVEMDSDRQQKELVADALNDDNGEARQKSAKDSVNHEGERNQKAFSDDLKNLKEEDKAHGILVTNADAVGDIDYDPRASDALALCSLTTSAEEARALDISSPEVDHQPAEVPILNDAPVEEVAPSPKNLRQDDDAPLQEPKVSITNEAIPEEAYVERNIASPNHTEETEHTQDSITDEVPPVEEHIGVPDESKDATPSNIHSALPAYDDTSYTISPGIELPATAPSLPERESISVPTHRERELSSEDEAKALVSLPERESISAPTHRERELSFEDEAKALVSLPERESISVATHRERELSFEDEAKALVSLPERESISVPTHRERELSFEDEAKALVSLPERESISVPTHRERELSFEDEAKALVSNLEELIEKVPADEADRDGRVFDSQLDFNTLQAPPHQHAVILPDTSVTTPLTPLNNAIHDPKSPYIYSYYPAFYPKGVYNTQNKSEEAEGMYGRPSPRVICVNTDTGKILGDKSNDQSNALGKYSPAVSNKEDDKLMLLKLLHEDIKQLKQQLKIQ